MCEVCGLHFDRPPIKHDPSLEQKPPGRPLNGLGFLEILDLQNSKEHTFDHIALTHRTLGEERRFLSDPFRASRSGLSWTTVLFIDDNPADLDFWSHGLRECSSAYSTLTATDIKSGLHLYQSQKVDCVILDLDLSGESGFEALFS